MEILPFILLDMTLTLNSNNFKHQPDKSSYNHNYYSMVYIDNGYATDILEVCHEDWDFYEYFLMDNNSKVFLGCSQNSLGGDGVVEIDFRKYYL